MGAIPSATSLPNLSKIDYPRPNSPAKILTTKPTSSIGENSSFGGYDKEKNDQILSNNDMVQSNKYGNVEGELSRYLISNEEMQRYEAEYQRASLAVKAA